MNKIDLLKQYLEAQAIDSELWTIHATKKEQYLQMRLRELHWLIDKGTYGDITSAIEDYYE